MVVLGEPRAISVAVPALPAPVHQRMVSVAQVRLVPEGGVGTIVEDWIGDGIPDQHERELVSSRNERRSGKVQLEPRGQATVPGHNVGRRDFAAGQQIARIRTGRAVHRAPDLDLERLHRTGVQGRRTAPAQPQAHAAEASGNANGEGLRAVCGGTGVEGDAGRSKSPGPWNDWSITGQPQPPAAKDRESLRRRGREIFMSSMILRAAARSRRAGLNPSAIGSSAAGSDGHSRPRSRL